jgi:hypothetical protein
MNQAATLSIIETQKEFYESVGYSFEEEEIKTDKGTVKKSGTRTRKAKKGVNVKA